MLLLRYCAAEVRGLTTPTFGFVEIEPACVNVCYLRNIKPSGHPNHFEAKAGEGANDPTRPFRNEREGVVSERVGEGFRASQRRRRRKTTFERACMSRRNQS